MNINMLPGITVFKKNLNSVYTEMNEAAILLVGAKTKQDVIGINDYELPSKVSEIAPSAIKNDQIVLQEQKTIEFLEIFRGKSDIPRIYKTTKSPIIIDGIVQGILGYNIDITNTFSKMDWIFSKDIKSISALITPAYTVCDNNFHSSLTPRQSECLFFLIRGKTIKEIGKILGLSNRTIEYYIDIMKSRFGCTTKIELIDIALEKGYHNIIPATLMYKSLSVRL